MLQKYNQLAVKNCFEDWTDFFKAENYFIKNIRGRVSFFTLTLDILSGFVTSCGSSKKGLFGKKKGCL